MIASTQGASFLQARQAYLVVVRLALAYRVVVQHTPTKRPNGKAQGLVAKLEKIQNKCLRVVVGAYRATPICSLEVETCTPLLDLYLDSQLATFQKRLENLEVSRVIENSYNQIQARIRNRNRRGCKSARNATIKEQREAWTKEQEEWFRQSQPIHQRFTKKQKVLDAQRDRWQTQEDKRKELDYQDQVKKPLDPSILQLHKGLCKVESSMLIQLRIGRTGLWHFLYKVRVPG